jgi:hypothetical protein
MTARRHGEESMDPFHDEVGFLLRDKANGQVIRNVVFGRGIAILAGSDAKPGDRVLRFDATGAEMHHTDENTLHRVKRYHPSVELS